MVCCPAWHLPESGLDPDAVTAKVSDVQAQLRQTPSSNVHEVVLRHGLQPHPDRVQVPMGLLHHLLPFGGVWRHLHRHQILEQERAIDFLNGRTNADIWQAAAEAWQQQQQQAEAAAAAPHPGPQPAPVHAPQEPRELAPGACVPAPELAAPPPLYSARTEPARPWTSQAIAEVVADDTAVQIQQAWNLGEDEYPGIQRLLRRLTPAQLQQARTAGERILSTTAATASSDTLASARARTADFVAYLRALAPASPPASVPSTIGRPASAATVPAGRTDRAGVSGDPITKFMRLLAQVPSQYNALMQDLVRVSPEWLVRADSDDEAGQALQQAIFNMALERLSHRTTQPPPVGPIPHAPYWKE